MPKYSIKETRKQRLIHLHQRLGEVFASHPKMPEPVLKRFQAVRFPLRLEQEGLFPAVKRWVKAAQVVMESFPKETSLAHRLGQEVLQEINKEVPALYYQATIEIELDHLRAKAIDLAQRHHPVAAGALKKLIKQLEHQNKLFFQKPTLTHEQYAKHCLKYLREASRLLRMHRGILGWLDKCYWVLCLIFAQEGSPADALIKSRESRGYFFFKTKTTERLEKLDQVLNARSFAEPTPEQLAECSL